MEMKQEFKMTQEEMDNIIALNKEGGAPVMFLSGGVPLGMSLQEKINYYWGILGNKYGFQPLTAEGSPKGKLYFRALPLPKVMERTLQKIEDENYSTLQKIVEQLELCNFQTEDGQHNIKYNSAFIALKRLATQQ